MNVDRIVIWGCGLMLVALVISDQREAAQDGSGVRVSVKTSKATDGCPSCLSAPASSPTYHPCPKLNAARKWLVAEIAQCPDSKPCQVWCEYQDQHLMTRNEVKL